MPSSFFACVLCGTSLGAESRGAVEAMLLVPSVSFACSLVSKCFFAAAVAVTWFCCGTATELGFVFAHGTAAGTLFALSSAPDATKQAPRGHLGSAASEEVSLGGIDNLDDGVDRGTPPAHRETSIFIEIDICGAREGVMVMVSLGRWPQQKANTTQGQKGSARSLRAL